MSEPMVKRASPRPLRKRRSRRQITDASGARRAALVRYRRALSEGFASNDPKRRNGMWRLWTRNLVRLVPLGGLSEGNDIEVLFTGDEVFERMMHAIAAAKDRVWMESYIFEADPLGAQMRAVLTAAAERGVDVKLIIDGVGSSSTPPAFFDGLRAAGAEVMRFNRLSVGRLFYRPRGQPSLLVRDHRKILVVDNVVAYTGGMNVGEEYAGPRLGNGFFRDSHIEVKGPAVADLAVLFSESYEDMTGTLLPLPKAVTPQPRDALLQVLRSNAPRHQTQIQRSLRSVLRHAAARCDLTTPYFIPSRRLVRALVGAAKRGVQVRILTAGKSDVALAKWAAEVFYARLLKAGVRIFEYDARTLHAKTVSVDGAFGAVGSFNLDHWSARRNHEVSVSAFDTEVAKTLHQQFDLDLTGAKEVSAEAHAHRSWWRRIRSILSYLVARL